jgi:hypothetical protein
MAKVPPFIFVLLAVFVAVVAVGVYAFPAVKEGFLFGIGKNKCKDWNGCCAQGSSKIYRWFNNRTCGACDCS